MNLLTNFLLTIGITIAVGIIVILFRKKEKELSQYILIALFSLLAFVVFGAYGELNGIKLIFNISFVFADSIGFLIGPLLLLYIKSIYQQENDVLRKFKWHFILPVLYVFFISIPVLISFRQEEALFSYIAFIEQHEWIFQLQVVYLLVYIWLSLRLLKKFHLVTRGNFSNLTHKDLNWIRNFLYGLIIIMLVNTSIEFFSLLANGQLSVDNTATTLVMIAVITYLGYYGTGQSRILLPNHLVEEINQVEKTITSHHLSNASEDEIKELESKLITVLQEQKPFENELLNLQMLAEMIPTTDRKLSALLNHTLNITFYDLINTCRVEAIKEKMEQAEYEQYTLLTMAYDAGFNSKSSFNRIFKKYTGLSPSAYKKHLQDPTN